MPDFGELEPLRAAGDAAAPGPARVLLRLAEQLERSRDQIVREAHVHMPTTAPSASTLDADGAPSVARWAAQREVDLFDRAFGKGLSVAS